MWSTNATAFQADVMWQSAHCPDDKIWLVGLTDARTMPPDEWQVAHIGCVEPNVAPAWHPSQVTLRWPPSSTKPVLKWSKSSSAACVVGTRPSSKVKMSSCFTVTTSLPRTTHRCGNVRNRARTRRHEHRRTGGNLRSGRRFFASSPMRFDGRHCS